MTGMGPNQGGSAELGEQGSVKEIGRITDDDKVRKLNAVRAYALTIPAATSKTAAVGFCWGGAVTSLFALRQPALNAAVAYYGGMPTDPTAYIDAKTPILGLYGVNDTRVNATLDLAKAELAKRNVLTSSNSSRAPGTGSCASRTETNGRRPTRRPPNGRGSSLSSSCGSTPGKARRRRLMAHGMSPKP